MSKETLRVLGKKCNVYELKLMCECGGNFIADQTNYTKIGDKYEVIHVCNKCKRITYVQDVYPKYVYRPFGEVIGFGHVETENYL